jgi:hypothetical protein
MIEFVKIDTDEEYELAQKMEVIYCNDTIE